VDKCSKGCNRVTRACRRYCKRRKKETANELTRLILELALLSYQLCTKNVFVLVLSSKIRVSDLSFSLLVQIGCISDNTPVSPFIVVCLGRGKPDHFRNGRVKKEQNESKSLKFEDKDKIRGYEVRYEDKI
jgi:hypothetical protein